MTKTQLKKELRELAKEIADELQEAEDLNDRIFEEVDMFFSRRVYGGRISEYDLDDMLKTIKPCSVILELAEENNCVETDAGLVGDNPYGIIAGMAFFSLETLLWEQVRKIPKFANV